MVFDNTKTLLCIFAPLGTTGIKLWIQDRPLALFTLKLRLILKKFHLVAASGTCHIKDILGLPKSLVLSWASNHNINVHSG